MKKMWVSRFHWVPAPDTKVGHRPFVYFAPHSWWPSIRSHVEEKNPGYPVIIKPIGANIRGWELRGYIIVGDGWPPHQDPPLHLQSWAIDIRTRVLGPETWEYEILDGH